MAACSLTESLRSGVQRLGGRSGRETRLGWPPVSPRPCGERKSWVTSLSPNPTGPTPFPLHLPLAHLPHTCPRVSRGRAALHRGPSGCHETGKLRPRDTCLTERGQSKEPGLGCNTVPPEKQEMTHISVHRTWGVKDSHRTGRPCPAAMGGSSRRQPVTGDSRNHRAWVNC